MMWCRRLFKSTKPKSLSNQRKVLKNISLKLLPVLAFFAIGAFVGFSSSQGAMGHEAPQASPSPSFAFDPKMLLKQFVDTQQAQMKAFQAKEKADTAALKSSQNTKQKEFDEREKVARKKYFAEQHPGAEKRVYMKALLARRDVFRHEQAEERTKAKDSSEKRGAALKAEQADRLKKFKESISRGERPDDALWPQPSLQ